MKKLFYFTMYNLLAILEFMLGMFLIIIPTVLLYTKHYDYSLLLWSLHSVFIPIALFNDSLERFARRCQ